MRSQPPITIPPETPVARWRRRRTAAASASAVAIAALLSTALLTSPAPATTEAPPRPELQHRMDEVVAAGAPGIVALVDDGGGRPWTGARGTADVRTGRPGDRFRAGSVTKSFVATVALELVDEGRLSLSDTVESRLPGVLPCGDQVALRQLLNHTSGVRSTPARRAHRR